MATPQIRYPLSVFGYDSQSPRDYGAVVEYVEASAAVTEGHAVEWDTANAGKVKTATTDGGTNLFAGIAAEAASAAGEIIPVVVTGFARAVVATTVTAGDRLNISATTAGQLASITAGVTVSTVANLGLVKATALEGVATTVAARCRVVIVKI